MALPDDVKDLCKDINKKFGNEKLYYEDQEESLKVEFISTGLINLDLATKPINPDTIVDSSCSQGGMPRGRYIEIYGPKGSGKTSLCLSVIAEAQKEGLNCALFDVENAYDPFYAKNVIGIDNNNLIISQERIGEEVLDMMEALIVSNKIDLIVLDSIAALPAMSVVQESHEQQHVGKEAKMWSKALRKLKGPLNKFDTTLIMTNQLREDPGVMYGNPEKTSGGRALGFYADMRLEVKKRDIYQESSGDTREDVGHNIRIRVKKNKVGKEGGYALIDVWYGEGYDKEKALMDAAFQAEAIERNGSWFSFNPTIEGVEQIKVQGKDSLINELKEHEMSKELFEDLRSQILGGDMSESESQKEKIPA